MAWRTASFRKGALVGPRTSRPVLCVRVFVASQKDHVCHFSLLYVVLKGEREFTMRFGYSCIGFLRLLFARLFRSDLRGWI